ncbi:ESPR domain-containing protein, partial [Paraburkholderia aspalathi]
MKYPRSVNHVYRLVWSQTQSGWIAVAEISRGRGKGSGVKRVLAALAAAALAHPAVATPPPTGVIVNAGTNGTDYTFDTSSPQNMTVTGTVSASAATGVTISGAGTIGT